MDIMEVFALGIDSFIASIAIAPILGRKLWIPFAAAFALCDGLGSLAGIVFQVQVSDAVEDTAETALPIALGVYWLAIALVTVTMQRSEQVGQGQAGGPVLAKWPIWLVPVALAVDNITYHLVGSQSVGSALGTSFGVDAWTSGLLSLIGIFIGVGLSRLIPAMKNQTVSFGVTGGALIIAGALIFALD